MLSSGRKSYAERVPVSPMKKITIYGPVTKSKGEQLKPQVRQRDDCGMPENQSSTHSKSNDSRPHAITPVNGKQMKTRLHCNHSKPSCESCIAKRKKADKQRIRPVITDVPRSSHVLPSSRSHPRGATDGRKLYNSDTVFKSPSIVDAYWIPGLSDSGEKQGNNLTNSNNAEMNGDCKLLSEEGSRKKVQFADGINKRQSRFCNGNSNHVESSSHQQTHSNHRPSTVAERLNHGNISNRNGIANSQRADNHNRINIVNSHKEYTQDNIPTRNETWRNLTNSNKNDLQSNTISTDFDSREEEDDCNLCDSRSKINSKHLSSKDRQIPHRLRTHSVPSHSSSTSDDESCLLCQRYGDKHYYRKDSDCCCLCEAPYKHPQKRFDMLHSNPVCHAERYNSHLASKRPPLYPQPSIPLFFSDDDDRARRKNIPYEPKTDIVKDLKKKLEDEYLHREYLKKKNFLRRWRSWDAEDLEHLRRFRHHHWDQRQEEEYVPHHKCIHRYLQNDRLFLEPTIMDEDGSSLCSECGLPQPKDCNEDPYLYHITLGGMQNCHRNHKEKVKKHHKDHCLKKHNCYKDFRHSSKCSSRLPGDTSKHLFTKLNRSVDNIFPKQYHYSMQPHLANEFRYGAKHHTKRHPCRSMALIDHLL